jgi:PKD repeat protein
MAESELPGCEKRHCPATRPHSGFSPGGLAAASARSQEAGGGVTVTIQRSTWIRVLLVAVSAGAVFGLPRAASAVAPTACGAITPSPLHCGDTPVANAQCSVAGGEGKTITAIQWDLDGNGTYELTAATASLPTVTTFADVSVGLQVTNSDNETGTTTLTATVNNTPPTASAGGPYRINPSSNLTLVATAAADAGSGCGDTITSYEWDFVQAGAPDTFETSATTNTKVVTWAQLQSWGVATPGVVYQVRVRVTDSRGGVTTSPSVEFRIRDSEPTACFTWSPTTLFCGSQPTFDAACTNPGGMGRSIVLYEWDLDGNGTYEQSGATLTSVQLPTPIASLASVTYRLRVTDDQGATATFTKALAPTNSAPTAVHNGPYVLDKGTALTLSAAGSSSEDAACGDTIVQYQWDFVPVGAADSYEVSVTTASTTVPWSTINAWGLSLSTLYSLKLRVRDSGNLYSPVVTTTFVIYDKDPVACFTAVPLATSCGAPIQFNPACTTHPNPNRSIVKWEWDWTSDGTYDVVATTGAIQTRAYTAFGDFLVTLRVTDNAGNPVSDTATETVSIMNRPPVAVTGGPYVLDKGTALTLNGNGSYDEDGACGDSIAAYAWDLNNDGVFGDATGVAPVIAWATLQPFVQIAAASGQPTNTIRLRVTDTRGATHTATTTLTVYDNVPTAAFTVTPNPAACRQQVGFSAATSSHGRPDRSIISYAWDWNADGVDDDFGVTAVHVFDAFGTYPVRLTVTDNNSPPKTATRTLDVVVNQGNQAPTAAHGGPYEIEENNGVTLDGSGSSDPDTACGDRVAEYAWDLNGDGVYDHVVSTPTLALTWTQLSTLARPTDPTTMLPINNVTLRVRDTLGVTHTATTTLAIYRNDPIASFTASPNPAACGQTITFDGSASHHGSAFHRITLWEWDWTNDGTYDATGVTQPYIFGLFGTYTVKLRVTDDNSPAKTKTTTVTVNVNQGNRPPIAEANGPYDIEENHGATLSAAGSSDPDVLCGDRIAKVEWDIGNDGTFEFDAGTSLTYFVPWTSLQGLARPTNPLTDSPKHTIAVRVTDTFGATRTDTATLRIYRNQPVAAFTATPNPAQCNQSVAFDATTSYHGFPLQRIVSYAWDYNNDGVTDATGAQDLRAFLQFGSYPVRLTVTDDNVPAKTATSTITVNVNQGNRAPVSVPGGPYITTLGAGVVFDGSGSSDPDAACGDRIDRYEWDANGDGVYDRTTTVPTVSFTWAELLALPNFRYPADPATGLPTNTVRLRVRDGFGLLTTATTTLTVYDDEPVALFTATPNPAQCNQQVAFDGTASLHGDPARTIVRYDWDRDGDGSFDATGPTTTYTYPRFGTYNVRLQVTDDSVPVKTATKTVAVNVNQGNRAPLAVLNGPYAIHVGDPLSISAASSSEPDLACGDSIVSYELDLDGDGTYERVQTSPVFNIAWPELSNPELLAQPAHPTTHLPSNTVALRVTDTFGARSVVTTALRIYDNVPQPAFTIDPSPAACGQSVTFDATASLHGSPLHGIVLYEWDLDGNGTYDATGPIYTHAFATYGTYSVRLRVTDNNVPAKTATLAQTVAVNQGNLPPIAVAGGPYQIDEGSPLTVNASASSDPNAACGDRIVQYRWDLNSDGTDDLVTTTPSAQVDWVVLQALQRPTDPITGVPRNIVTLRVTDTFGAVASAVTTLSIYRNQPTAAFAASPNPAACSQVVTLDGTASRHESALHQLVEYAWDLDGNGTWDRVGPEATFERITHAYPAFGSYTVRLRVTDNNTPSQSATVSRVVDVSLGNRTPVAETTGPYTTSVGAGLTVDATPTTDADTGCGDRIVSYEWDLNGDGVYDRTVTTPRLDLLWTDLSTLVYPADPVTGQPYNTVTLRVTDSFGAVDTVTTALRIYANTPVACAQVRPDPVACGQAATLDASCSYASNPDYPLTEWAWDLDNNGTFDATGQTITHTFTAFGDTTVRLRVRDSRGNQAFRNITVRVSAGNVAPVAATGGPYVTTVGGALLLDASGSTDANVLCGDSIVEYAWDLNNDGIFERTGTSSQLSLTWATLTNLAHPADPVTGLPANVIQLRVRDSFGLTSVAATTIRIYDNTPRAVASVSPNPARCNQSLTFSGVESWHGDPRRTLAAYRWDFDGNGTVDATGAAVTYAYPAFGTYDAKLTVVDDNTPTKSSTVTVRVNVNQGNRAPVAVPGGPYTAIVGRTLALNASGSSDPDAGCGDRVAQYRWDLDADGTDDYTTTEATLTVPWERLFGLAVADPATGLPKNPLRLTVRDTFGLEHVETTTITIYADGPIPCIDATPLAPGCGQAVLFDASCSGHQNPARTLTLFEWDLNNDGAYDRTGRTLSHTFATSGAHVVKLRVTDDGTPQRSATATVTITMAAGDTPPVAAAGGPYHLDYGAGALFAASGSYEPDAGCGDRIVRYEWDFDGDGTYTGALDRSQTLPDVALSWAEVQARFPQVADPTTGLPNKTVRLRVTDATGRQSVEETTVAVFRNLPTACYTATVLSGRCGLVYRFDASCSVQGHIDHEILHWRWDLGGTSAFDADAEVVEWEFPDYGNYTVKLVVADDNVPPRTDTLAIETMVRFVDTPPDVVPGGPYEGRVGQPVTLDASASSDFDANCGDEVARYEWDLNGDGAYDIDTAGAVVTVPWTQLLSFGVAQPAHPDTGEPSNRVRLRVTDTHGLMSEGETTLTIYGTEPVACLEATPNPAGCGELVQFDAGCAWHRDPQRTIVGYAWDLDGNGTDDAFGPTAATSYPVFGDYRARLTVTDDSDPPRTASTTLTVRSTADNTPPVAAAGGPYGGTVGESLRLDASGSYDPNVGCGDSVVQYEWDFQSDGTYDLTTTQPVVTVPWAQLQNLPYPADPATGRPNVTLTLRVRDSLGVRDTDTTTLAFYRNAPVACFTATPDPGRCGQDILLDARCSSHGHRDHAVTAWSWDVGNDGTIDGMGPTRTVNYATFGDKPVRLVVLDDNTPPRQAEIVQMVRVSAGNRAPRAEAGGPYGFALGADLRLDASGSFEPDASCDDRIVSYAWDLDNDGQFDDAVGTSAIVTVPAAAVASLTVPTDPLSGQPLYPIALRVTDTFGLTHTATTTMALYDDRPLACFEVNPSPAFCGEPVTLDASCSRHLFPQRTLTRYQWDLNGDGSFDREGSAILHTFPQFGTYRVRLRVTDDTLRSVDTTVSVVVSEGNVPPVAEAGGPYIAEVGGSVTLRAGGSVDPNAPCGDRIEIYEWDLNQDGVYEHQSASPNLPITWAEILAAGLAYPADPGTGLPRNTIALRVRDTFGEQSTDQSTLTIYDNRPRAAFSFSPDPAGCNQTVSFDASATTHGHPGHANVSYVWNFGDGTPTATGVQVLHPFSRFGTFQVRLRVTDDSNRSDEVVRTVSVSADDRPPIPRPLPPSTVIAGPVTGYELDWASDLLLDAAASSDPDASCGDRITEYAWDYQGDGSFDALEVDPQRSLAWGAVQLAFGFDCCSVPDPMDPDAGSGCLRNGCADPDTGEPSFGLRLRVKDTFGVTAIAETRLIVYQNLPRACFTARPNPAGCDETVTFDATCSRHLHPGRRIVRYEWDLDGDGEFDDGTRPIEPFSFGAFGRYAVALRVTDDNDPPRSDTFSLMELDGVGLDVSSGNRPPVAAPGGPYDIDQGAAVELDASGSTDPDAACDDEIVRYEWDLGSDGTWDFRQSAPQLPLGWFEISGLAAGRVTDPETLAPAWPFTLRVTDRLGLQHTAEGLLRVFDNRPRADLRLVSGADGCRDVFRFSAAGSSHGHPGHAIVSYQWDFDGDGRWDATGRTADHRFNRFGKYTVRLRVEDDNVPPRAAEATLEVIADSANSAPVADPGGPYVTWIASSLTLDASRSRDADISTCDDAIVTYEWDLNGDGAYDLASDGPLLPLRWGDLTNLRYPADPETGEPTNPIGLRVTDRFGLEGTATTTISIYAEEPVACFESDPEPAACTDVVVFDGRCSRHTSSRSIDKWEWDFDGDGTFDANGATAQHVFGVNGVYRVTLRVSDDRRPPIQDEVVRIVTVSVGNHPPKADAGGPYRIGPGWSIELDGRSSADEDSKTCGDAVVAWRWDLDGDGEFDDAEGDLATVTWTDLEALGVTAAIRAAADGEGHVITLEVADLVGETATAEATLLFTDQPPILLDGGSTDTDAAGDGDTVSSDTTGSGGGGCQAGGGPRPFLPLTLLGGLLLALLVLTSAARRRAR